MKGFPRAVRECLQKAKDSALLAVEVYNKPAVSFKSAGYIMLMVIAWTSLFHAVFFKRKSKPFYRKPSGRFIKADGEPKHWELDECLRQYYGSDTGNPVRKNLEFFIPLRNKIEHRNLPELDSGIFGECQAMLLNFDECLEKEFGSKWCIRQCLSFALQMYPTSENLAQAAKRNRAAQAAADFVQQYRSALDPGVFASGKYAFKAFLIQVANHQSQDALAIQFKNYDKLSDQEKTEVDRLVVAVKYRQPSVANADLLRPTDVVTKVKQELGDPKRTRGTRQYSIINSGWHVNCWRKYGVRPSSSSGHPEKTNTRFCIYDERHDDYSYTEEWVRYLIAEFKAGRLCDEVSAGIEVTASASPSVAAEPDEAHTGAASGPPTD